MEPESFNIDDYIKDGKLNLTEKTYRKYDKEFIATKIIDKIQSGELKFPHPPEYCTPKFKEDAFQILKKYEPRVKVLSVSVVDDSHINAYTINIKFNIISIADDVNLEMYLERIR